MGRMILRDVGRWPSKRKGGRWERGLKIHNLGCKLKSRFIARLGTKIKNSGSGEYV